MYVLNNLTSEFFCQICVLLTRFSLSYKFQQSGFIFNSFLVVGCRAESPPLKHNYPPPPHQPLTRPIHQLLQIFQLINPLLQTHLLSRLGSQVILFFDEDEE